MEPVNQQYGAVYKTMLGLLAQFKYLDHVVWPSGQTDAFFFFNE